MDENIKTILENAADLILKKYGLKLDDVSFVWFDISTPQKNDFMLAGIKINGVCR